MIPSERFILSNSISYNIIADYIICLSPDIGSIPPILDNDLAILGTLFVDDKPYSISKVADRLGLSLHTKKERQDVALWNTLIDQVQLDISKGCDFLGNPVQSSTFKFLLTDRINWRLSNDCLPNSKNYLATYKDRFYLDLYKNISSQYELEPFNENFSIKKFDTDINLVVDDENIVYFTGDNIVYDVATTLKNRYKILWDLTIQDIYNRIYDKPWFIIKEMLTSNVNPWKYINGNYDHVFLKLVDDLYDYIEKAEIKLQRAKTRSGMVEFDMGMVHLYPYEQSLNCYKSFCNELSIEPNIIKFTELFNKVRENRIKGVGKDIIPEQYFDIFNSITKLILNTENIYLDTELKSIRWNVLCQIIFKCAIAKYNENISLEFSDKNTVLDLINSIYRMQ